MIQEREKFFTTFCLNLVIKTCLNETYSEVRVGKLLSDTFPIQIGLKQGDVLLPLLFHFALKYSIRKVQGNQVCLELNGTHQLVVYAHINFLGCSINTIKENTDTVLEACRSAGLEINAEKMKYMMMSSHPNSGQNQSIRIANESFENMAKFKYLGMMLTNQERLTMKSRVAKIQGTLAITRSMIFRLPVSYQKI
jgi:hypothetical protein